MNEIERLIAGLPRPSPSAKLDSRIARLAGTSQFDRQTATNGPVAARRLIVTVASTASAALLGFILGRYSAAPAVASQTMSVTTISPMDSIPSAHPTRDRPVVSVQVPECEELVRFVMPAKRTAGLFGSGPLVDQSTFSQLE